MIGKLINALIVMALFVLSSCSLPHPQTISTNPLPDHPSVPASETASIIENTLTPTFTLPALTPSPTIGSPMLTLTGNYYCNLGPGANYTRIVYYPAGTVLPIIGSNGDGWWLVQINDTRTRRTECWIGGGTPSGNLNGLPLPSPMPAVPAHDPTNWANVALLTCSELGEYDWTWNGSGSGEYSSLTPIIEINNATIVYSEYNPICPGFLPHLMVPIHDKDTGTAIGYMSCSDIAGVNWYWDNPGGGWLSSTALFGNSRATFIATEMSMNCPSVTPVKVVPVHDVSWAIIGFLGCPDLGSYTWNLGAGSGEYIASVTLFGSSQATIYYGEYNPACPSFKP